MKLIPYDLRPVPMRMIRVGSGRTSVSKYWPTYKEETYFVARMDHVWRLNHEIHFDVGSQLGPSTAIAVSDSLTTWHCTPGIERLDYKSKP